MWRERKAKILATLGPATSQRNQIAALFNAGADVFRLNFSHGDYDDHRRRVQFIRDIEKEVERPIGVLLDLQGPKLRLGLFADTEVTVKAGDVFRLDTDESPGTGERVQFPHAELYSALAPGTTLLVDDGRVSLRVTAQTAEAIETEVQVGGVLSNRKGVNVPGVLLPLSPLTPKDREDLRLGLDLGVDWVALSFVQRASDVEELRELVDERAAIMAKLEKPAALDSLREIVRAADGVMIARGDLGVELPPEQVPVVQKRIMSECRQAGKPVVVATQMLESMIHAPLPTRAEASDVATAVYDGADAVMLSAETAVGEFPKDAVEMMDRIVIQAEKDRHYVERQETQHLAPESTTADAICYAMQSVAHTLHVAAAVTYTSSGFSAVRAARERPEVPILSLTPKMSTARRLTLVWGVHSVHHEEVYSVQQMVDSACQMAVREQLAKRGDRLVIAAGQPFGTSGTTNLLRVARIPAPRKRPRSRSS
ncbi:MAG: pyruvate kinase [Gammaproteobacteria bacterium]|nr:pyruvate kinase [Gammaproteobacteria bacterium]